MELRARLGRFVCVASQSTATPVPALTSPPFRLRLLLVQAD